jgi:drug/metabolite transporter (DMT)-like permease
MQQQPRYLVFVVLSVILLWGTAATAFEIALRSVTPYQLLLWSVAVSTLVLGLLLLSRGGPVLIRAAPPGAVARSLALGVLNPFLYYLVLFEAYARLPGQVAMALNYAWPLVLALLAVPILGQPLSRGQTVAIGASFIGAVVIVSGGQLGFDGGLDPLGVALALGSTLIWAVFWLANARDGLDPGVKLFCGFAVGLVLVLIAAPWLGGDAGATLPPARAWPALVYIGLFEMGLTFLLWLTALQGAKNAGRLGHLVYLTPFLSLLFLHLIIGEPILPATFVGLAMIVGSLLWRAWADGRA